MLLKLFYVITIIWNVLLVEANIIQENEVFIERRTLEDPITYGSYYYEVLLDGKVENIFYEEEDSLALAHANELIECLIENCSHKGIQPKVKYG